MTATAHFDDGATLGAYLDHHAEHYPERIALRDRSGELTYAALHREVARCAAALRRSGVVSGDRIAVLAPPRVEALVTFFAAAKLGAVWLGLNPKYKLPELEYVISDARPRLIFGVGRLGERDFTTEIAAIRAQFDFVETMIGFDGAERFDASFGEWLGRNAESHVEEDASPALPALLVYTSGSTGRPKGALLSQRSLLRRSRTQNAQFPARDFPRIMNPLPINHIGGMHFLTLYAFVGGGTVILEESHDPAAFVAALKAGEINILYTLPTILQMLVDQEGFEPALLDKLEWVIYSGAAMSRELVDLLFAADCAVGLTYGMTETCGSVTYAKKLGDNKDVMTGTIGYPTPEGEARIVAEGGAPVKIGEQGELQVLREYSMTAYFERPKETAEVFTDDGWMNTGDLARLREDGSFEFVGRISEMFKSGGYNVYPREIEMALEEHPDVTLGAVIGVPDPLFTEVGWAYVIPRPGAYVTGDELKAWCAARLANYKVPKKFAVVEGLPMLPVGKVDKVTLKREARENA